MAYEGEDTQALAKRAMVDHRPPSVTEKLQQERAELAKRVDEIDEILMLLEANPTQQEILDRLARLGRGMF